MKDKMKALVDRVRDEPVLLTSAVSAVLVLLVAFKVPVSDEQAAAISGVILAGLALVARHKSVPKRKARK